MCAYITAIISLWMTQRALNPSCIVVADVCQTQDIIWGEQIQVLCKSSVVPLAVCSS